MARTIIALSLLLLAGTVSAGRTLEIRENAIEASLADVTMPGGAAGTVIIDPSCAGCEPRALRASTDIRYFVDGRSLPRAEFMTQVEQIRDTDGGASSVVGIFYDRESEQVTRIKLFGNGG